jgi:hypothetical protein
MTCYDAPSGQTALTTARPPCTCSSRTSSVVKAKGCGAYVEGRGLAVVARRALG